MPTEYSTISYAQLAFATCLMAINVGISIAFRLNLSRSLAIASIRMVVQLLAIGFVLEWLFERRNPWLIVAIALLMAGVAGRAALGRTKWHFAGTYWNSLISILLAAAVVTSWTIGVVVRVEPWYDPQYLIPLIGMVLGNALNGISLGLDRFVQGLIDRQSHVETLLALGATRWEAARQQIQDAVRTGMIPITNSMMVMGLVSLPGMMTGQILAGASPIDAVRYQIAIVFAIASGTALGTFGVVLLAFNRLLSPTHQLRLDRVRKAGDRA